MIDNFRENRAPDREKFEQKFSSAVVLSGPLLCEVRN